MAQAPNATVRFRRRLLGYDRRAVDATLASAADKLERAETRRDELIETTANVERIGAQVADMLRTLADRAVQLETEAAQQAAQVVKDAEADAAQLRAQGEAALAEAQATAQQIVESSRQQQAVIGQQQETALISLRIAMDQMGRLATMIDQIDLTTVDATEAPATEPPVVEQVVWARLEDWASSTR